MVRLTFHGAAETVTGSKYLLEADRARVLIDCGMFQGLKELRLLNWAKFPFAPSAVNAVVLTHAHIDHLGMLPRLVSQGYRGPIFATPATCDLAELMLYDAAKNQESDAEYANRKSFSKHKPALPLYDDRDVAQTLRQFRAQPRDAWFSPVEPLWCRYHDAGHLLGSAMIEVEVRQGPRPLRLLFSGDIGRYGAPLYHDPSPPPACDYLICESTYGNRDHPRGNVVDELARVMEEALRRGGVVVVPSFAVGRSQQLIYLLEVLFRQKRLPELPIYLDSPMAINASKIYRDHAADHDLSEAQLKNDESVLSGMTVHLTRSAEESKRINEVQGPAVIIASSGMMIGGRILHHLKRRLPDSRNTILLGGFMAAGTRGRALQEGARSIRMHGLDVPVRAAVVQLSGLSGHAGHDELLRWLAPLAAPRRAFITHGELAGAKALAAELHETRGWNTHVPRLGESVELENVA
ncbi:MAG: MBL fold metallo-hydrolase [Pirellulales bacterium]|nr:MBL fold metallo-hydrolase [Pirellulales bacterium]